jgi:hypothetical protein
VNRRHVGCSIEGGPESDRHVAKMTHCSTGFQWMFMIHTIHE